jgi:hypothetical protein
MAVVALAAAVSGKEGQPHPAPGHGGHGALPAAPTAVTPEQRAAAARLLEDVRAGTARFVELRAAQEEGYRQTTTFSFGRWGPAHFNNTAFTRDGRWLDAQRPEALVYMRFRDGRMVLLGAMFVAPKGQGPRPGGTLTEWHVHDNLCLTAAGTVALATGPGQCPAGSFFVGDAVEMMHVWTFAHPDRPFAHSLTPAALRAVVQQFGGL